jgi:hypothetical protein
MVSGSVINANNSAMSGLTASNLPAVCVVWGQSPARGMPGKGQYSINTNMLQLQVGGWRGTSSLQLVRLQACQGNGAKENLAESAQDYNRKGVLLHPHHPRTILCSGATQLPQLPSIAQAYSTTAGEMCASPPMRHNQEVSSQSVHASNKNN